MEDDDHLYERLERDWDTSGRPCPKCGVGMEYDSHRSNQNSVLIPGNHYGTRIPVYDYYRCPKCGHEK